MTPMLDIEPIQDGNNFEQYLRACWGRDGNVGWLILQNFVKLANVYGWNKVYNIVQFSAKMNKKSLRYCEVALQKEAEREQQMLNRSKSLDKTIVKEQEMEQQKPVLRTPKWEAMMAETMRKLKSGESFDEKE